MKTLSKKIFFIGKGGVGKSTSSAITALKLADQGESVLLVSMDPAHNQSDIFEKDLSKNIVKITQNLYATEINIDYWIKKYLEDIENQIRKSYSYLTSFNLDDYFGIIKYSPGIEEYALLTAYVEISKKFSEKKIIIFDMPPTALTLKFFGLPKLSLDWLEKLLNLRNQIIKKREIITKIKLGKIDIQSDKILNKLNKQIATYVEVRKDFAEKDKTSINLVINSDKLSLSESKLILEKLGDLDLEIDRVILNKFEEGIQHNQIAKSLNICKYQLFKISDQPLIGLRNLKSYLEHIDFLGY